MVKTLRPRLGSVRVSVALVVLVGGLVFGGCSWRGIWPGMKVDLIEIGHGEMATYLRGNWMSLAMPIKTDVGSILFAKLGKASKEEIEGMGFKCERPPLMSCQFTAKIFYELAGRIPDGGRHRTLTTIEFKLPDHRNLQSLSYDVRQEEQNEDSK